MMGDTGRSPDGSGSRASHEAAISVASSPEASIPNASIAASFAVLREAVRAGHDSAKWPRLSPGEAKTILAGLREAQEGGWRCFHCGEVFTDRELAEDHFGFTSLHPPGCVDPLRSDERAMRERATFYERAWRKALQQRDALAAATGTAKTPTAAECEASQSGAAKTAQRPNPSAQRRSHDD